MATKQVRGAACQTAADLANAITHLQDKLGAATGHEAAPDSPTQQRLLSIHRRARRATANVGLQSLVDNPLMDGLLEISQLIGESVDDLSDAITQISDGNVQDDDSPEEVRASRLTVLFVCEYCFLFYSHVHWKVFPTGAICCIRHQAHIDHHTS